MSKILILMSTYNGEKYLREQIESIRNQTIKEDIEILVRDDGSKDGTLEILEEYAEIGTLQFIRGKNIGSAQSFHELLRIAPKYDYYAFADQDDDSRQDLQEFTFICELAFDVFVKKMMIEQYLAERDSKTQTKEESSQENPM